ncbi:MULTISPECIES: hypothetical protein [unclassified Tenacibaculum]|uniref:hypothetical protein n=1 Tax=unclassified Tenacibaculum TaxID=2635139 RepID=UPI001F29F4F4|nr:MULTISPECIES: hypothetical protein [unclassified Tenacibaculum]MCF2873862.1 hypothetical protein [Tenacibaculum sp. Cn5-1]MCF2936672.1 hypothetical protein [Tenacibaculum sp. Cn5-34]MCG7512896.1 hypothetical protein [Tenacibaculum sp. Cn5-46]
MKKTFFLSKGIEKFSNLEINDLSPIRGGAVGIPSDDIIYIPTGGGGRRCPDGLVWSDRLGKCVKILEADPVHDFIRN